MRRWRAVFASSLLIVLGAAPPAHAADGTYSWRSQTFELLSSFQTLNSGICGNIEIDGTLKYQTYTGAHNGVVLKTMKVIAPSMAAFTRTSCGRSGTPVKVPEMDFKMEWWDHQCHIKPTVSVGYPWAIIVEATRDCSTISAAREISTYETPSTPANWTHTQYNSTSTITWSGSSQLASSGSQWCAAVNAIATIYYKGDSDAVTLNDKACITWSDAVH